MAPPRKHPTDALLDAAREIVLRDGPRAASVAAISKASGAPVGTIYHRFGSRDGMLVEVWVRALARFQRMALDAADGVEDPVDRGVAFARASIEFAAAHPADAQLLLALRRDDLIDRPAGGELKARLGEMNAPLIAEVTDLARRLRGGADARSRAAVTRAVVELPYAAVRRYAGVIALPAWLADDVADDARTLLSRAR